MFNIITIIKKRNIFLLLLIIALGTWLRFKGLIFNGHWLDELYSADFSNPAKSFNSMLKITLEDVHPPLYQALLWICYKIFGFTEYTGRALSATIGTLGIVAIYFLGKDLFNKYVGLYAALLSSVNIFLITYSQETRSYGLLFLLTTLSYLYFHKVLYNPIKTNIVLYWVTTIALFYTHYISFIIIAAQLIFIILFIIQYSNNKKQLFTISLLTTGIFIVFISPLVPYILDTVWGDGHSWITNNPSPLFFIGYNFQYFGGIKAFLVIFLGGAISLGYLLSGKLSGKAKFSLIVLLIWISMGYLLPYLKSILFSPMLQVRYTTALVPAIILVASYGLLKIRGWKGCLILSLYFLYSLHILFTSYYGQVKKDQYREVLMEVAKYNFVPIYERIPFNGHHGNVTNHYQTIAKMLKLNMNIQNDIDLKKDLKGGGLPECFWALNAHFFSSINVAIDKSELIKNPSIKVVKKISYRGAEGILLSYKTEPDICLKKVSSQ